jgi:hypothetical protein
MNLCDYGCGGYDGYHLIDYQIVMNFLCLCVEYTCLAGFRLKALIIKEPSF